VRGGTGERGDSGLGKNWAVDMQHGAGVDRGPPPQVRFIHLRSIH
jgi:hypothetical protein